MNQLEFHPIEDESPLRVQMIDAKIHAGFPSPVDVAYQQQPIDLNKELVNHPATSFIAHVIGDSMINEGVEDGDLLVIDRSIEPDEDHISICCLEGEFALKRIKKTSDALLLLAANDDYPPIKVKPEMNFSVWGVVTWIMKRKY